MFVSNALADAKQITAAVVSNSTSGSNNTNSTRDGADDALQSQSRHN